MFNPEQPGWIITFVFAAIMIATWLSFELSKKSRHSTLLPNLLTILGILGTFVGITAGLLAFEVENVSASIPGLLGGLRAAFITSILGMFFAFVLRLRNHSHALAQKQRVEDVTLADLVSSMDLMRKESSAANRKLVQALSGDEEGTMLGQIKLLRADGKDDVQKLVRKLDEVRSETVGKLDEMRVEGAGKIDNLRTELVSEFRSFAEKMAEQNTDALIEALSGVIRDFNEKLTEQFGENFKELNKAVGQLVQWQVHYRKTLEDLHRHLKLATASVETSEKSLSVIEEKYTGVVSTSEELQKILEVYAGHNDLLSSNMERFAESAASFEEKLPHVKETVEALTTGFSEAVTTSLKQVQHATDAQGEAAETMARQAEQFGQSVVDANRQTSEHIKSTFESTSTLFSQLSNETTAAVNRVTTETIGAFNDNVRELVQNHLRQLEASNTNVTNTLHENLVALDSELGNALTQSLESLGQQLTALSQRFVADYAPLTDRLREVVRLAEHPDA